MKATQAGRSSEEDKTPRMPPNIRAQEVPSQGLWVVQLPDESESASAPGVLFQVHMSRPMAEQIAQRENTRHVHAGSDGADGPALNLGAAIHSVLARTANTE